MTHTLDSYGGTTQLKGKSTGWFHLEELDGRRWFITPEGNAFFPVSLSHIYTGNSQPTVCGVNFCATLYDLDDGPLMKMAGMMEGLYDWDGDPKPGLVDVVREANKEIYERATDPYGSSEIVELDENLCRVRDEVHKHIR